MSLKPPPSLMYHASGKCQDLFLDTANENADCAGSASETISYSAAAWRRRATVVPEEKAARSTCGIGDQVDGEPCRIFSSRSSMSHKLNQSDICHLMASRDQVRVRLSASGRVPSRLAVRPLPPNRLRRGGSDTGEMPILGTPTIATRAQAPRRAASISGSETSHLHFRVRLSAATAS